jgi:hypothetical protein
MAQQAITTQQGTAVRRWTIEGFKSFWAKPDPCLVPLLYDLATSDIVGHWPRPIGKVHGAGSYVPVIDAILRVAPDLSLSVAEYVRSDDLHFVRWIATGTGSTGAFEFDGLDRLRTTADGRVCENYVFCDHPFFVEVAAYLHWTRSLSNNAS